MKPLLLASEVAELLRVSERTVRYWAKDGLLPCVYLCREIRFRHEDIEKAMREGIEPKQNKIPSFKKCKSKKKGELMAWEKPIMFWEKGYKSN